MVCDIKQLERGKFNVSWKVGEENIFLNLDFNPLLVELLTKGVYSRNCCFLHFQGKPKNLRRFAVYDSLADDYICFEKDEDLIINARCNLFSLNEEIHATLPTSVLLFPDSKLIKPLNSPYYLVSI